MRRARRARIGCFTHGKPRVWHAFEGESRRHRGGNERKRVASAAFRQGERPFYRLRHFKARPEQPLLPLDQDLWLSDNFFRPSWLGLGERRLKTAHVLLEWHPEVSAARQKRGMQRRLRRIFQELQQTGRGTGVGE